MRKNSDICNNLSLRLSLFCYYKNKKLSPIFIITTISVIFINNLNFVSCNEEKQKLPPQHDIKIPDFLHVCKRFDPHLVECIQNSINELKPHLRKGIPEMNVPPLEPLLIKELVAAQSSGLKITTEDLKVHGCSNFTIKKLLVNLKDHKFFFSLDLPHLVLDGRYVVDGRVILIPVKGNGPLTGDIYKAKANVTLVGELIKKNGEDYIHYTDMKIRFKVGSGKLKLDNLFNGERVLGEIINTAINLNFELFIQELTPIIESVLAKFMLESANKIVADFPYRVLFPDH
ncbi:protein takeout-like [Lycorma delicatula]|uniref:protein takeout-like n=1 Tax=Lycorma delicatula TaxID=130591 RepID=UPI003F513F0F